MMPGAVPADAGPLVLAVADIHAGSSTTAAGWVMGPFFPSGDIRATHAFEIKEWNAMLVQSSWRDHTASGPEYIAVIAGTLTVICGAETSSGLIDETARVSVSTGQRIIMPSGAWRRYIASEDATGITVRSSRAGAATSAAEGSS